MRIVGCSFLEENNSNLAPGGTKNQFMIWWIMFLVEGFPEVYNMIKEILVVSFELLLLLASNYIFDKPC